METLRTAPFGTLFGAAFVVGAVFQLAMTILGIVLAFVSPSLFRANGQVMTDPLQAVGVVLFLAIFGLACNAAVSAGGAGLWVVLRRLLPKD